MSHKKIKIICIVGPTASGKTALSIELAKKYNGEIISADSMQLYKDIHIASAAPDIAEMQGIPHHLIEFLDLGCEFSVADYVLKAREIIFDIDKRGKTPIIAGGTGLYINSLGDNIEFVHQKFDTDLRNELEEKLEKVGAETMLKELYSFDPETAARLHPNNKRRIIRAFEVYISTGKTISRQNELSHRKDSPFDITFIGITYKNREELYSRINRRVDIMIKNGLLDEARTTIDLKSGKGALQAIGHKELYGYIKGEIDLETAVQNLKMQTRRYAKRQLTWFKRDPDINWIYADETGDTVNEAIKIIEQEITA